MKAYLKLPVLGLIGVLLALSIAGARLPVAYGVTMNTWNKVSYRRGFYNLAFFYRHNHAYRRGSAIHFAHGKAHDVLLLSKFKDHEQADAKFEAECLHFVAHPPWTEPEMEYYGPFTGQVDWTLYRTIDWTHVHHEQTYDIMASKRIKWDKKAEVTKKSADYYLKMLKVARSPAPLDVTMRRAAVMMKPYFTLFRNYYPKSNNFFYWAHWWHPAIYEAQIMGGNGPAQDEMVDYVELKTSEQVLKDRPLKMMLSREMMPRYSRMSPESANIFDNLHMLHGIAYDILSYDAWSNEQKQQELDRVIKAMSYHPGDEKLVRKFQEPYPDMDPRVYAPWMKPLDGEMNRIMKEMWAEMIPLMMSQGMSSDMKAKMQEQFRMKMTPGMEPGELPGSLHDAMKALMPGMKMMPEAMEAGKTPQMMVDAMLKGWQEKYGNLPDIPPWPMMPEPTQTQPLPVQAGGQTP